MDPALVGESSQPQSLNDIQNYLVTFNKEIQDTSSQELVNSNSSTAVTTNNTNSQNFNQNTNYTAPFNAQMNQVQDYQTFDQTQNFYNNNSSYYTGNTSGYQPSMDQQPEQQFPSFDASFSANASNGQFDPTTHGDTSINSQNWQGAQTKETNGAQILQTLVNTASGTTQTTIKNADGSTTVVGNMPIIASVVGSIQTSEDQSTLVMMDASQEGQMSEGTMEDDNDEAVSAEVVAGVQLSQPAVQSAEELLHAVQAQDIAADQPTFVAMQPVPGDAIGVSQGDETVMEHHLEADLDPNVTASGISALLQAGAAAVQEGTAQVVTTEGQTTIQMVVHHADGSTHQQQIPVSTGSAPPGATVISADGQEVAVSDDGTLQMMANLAEQAAASEGGELGNNSVILNTGNSYQTVTIVPSDTNPGEVSYVLIVSQPEDGKDGHPKNISLDMSVYDFSEEGQQAGDSEAATAEQNTVPAKRAIKVSPKKSQLATQAHMCNYCNYTSPKRYLLSRHMKSHSEERPHKCNVCERGFKTIASLQNHINTHTGTRPHQCKE